MRRLDQLLDYIAIFSKKLKDCQYVGEICLAEEELNDFSKELEIFRNKLNKKSYDIALLVLAVNIAYYYYDENGFWNHFSNITKIENKEMVGKAIERTLCELQLLKIQRNGPFRYVGAILEQCGVSKKYIPSFVLILKEVKRRYNDLPKDLKYSELISILSEIYCSKYLKDFLLDEEGTMFTLQVLRNIRMYENGVLDKDELSKLNGFRPGFWNDILMHFNIDKKKNLVDNYNLIPQLKLNVNKYALELIFPSQKFIDGMVDGINYSYPTTQLSDPRMLKEKYKGKIISTNWKTIEWEIDGWKPDNHPVLFDISKRTLIPPHISIPPGNYYLLAPKAYKLPNDIPNTFLGYLTCSLIEKYCLYKVYISFGNTIKGLNIMTENVHEQITINFLNPEEKLFKYHDGLIDVFIDNIPDLWISDFRPIEQNIIGLFYDFGKFKGRIKYKSDFIKLKKEIQKYIPFKGRIWLEVIVRSNKVRISVNSELFFYVIPYRNIIGTEHFYGLAQNPILQVENVEGVQLKLIGSTRKNNEYVFPAKTQVVHGKIIFDHEIINFEIPLKRLGLLNEKGQVLRFLERSELSNEKLYVLYGPPGTQVRLFYASDHTIANKVLDDNGKAEITGRQLQEAIVNREIDIIPIEATIKNKSFSLEAYVIDSDIIFNNLNSNIINFPRGPIEEISNILKLIIKAPVENVIRTNRMPQSITQKFDDKIREYLYCAQLIDGTAFVINDTNIDWSGYINNEELKKIIYAYESGIWDESINNYLLKVPNVERWIKAIEGHIKRFAPDSSIDILDEWSKEVKSFLIMSLRSSISAKKGGRSLTQAWSSYYRNYITEALKRLNDISDDCSELVKDLSQILKTIIYLRQARFTQAVIKQMNTKSLDELRLIIESLIYRLNGRETSLEKNMIVSRATKSIIHTLPFTNEDSRLLLDYITFLETKEIKSESLYREDWLLNWMLVNLCQENLIMKKEIAASLSNYKGIIPSSKDKEAILEYINRLLKGE